MSFTGQSANITSIASTSGLRYQAGRLGSTYTRDLYADLHDLSVIYKSPLKNFVADIEGVLVPSNVIFTMNCINDDEESLLKYMRMECVHSIDKW